MAGTKKIKNQTILNLKKDTKSKSKNCTRLTDSVTRLNQEINARRNGKKKEVCGGGTRRGECHLETKKGWRGKNRVGKKEETLGGGKRAFHNVTNKPVNFEKKARAGEDKKGKNGGLKKGEGKTKRGKWASWVTGTVGHDEKGSRPTTKRAGKNRGGGKTRGEKSCKRKNIQEAARAKKESEIY